MFSVFNYPPRQLAAAKRVLGHVAEHADMPIAVRLWDGSVVPLGDPASPLTVAIRSPGVIGSLLRRPTLDSFLRQYATGGCLQRPREMGLSCRILTMPRTKRNEIIQWTRKKPEPHQGELRFCGLVLLRFRRALGSSAAVEP